MATTTATESLKGPIVLIKEGWEVYKRNAGTYVILILLSMVLSVVGVAAGVIAGVIGFALTQQWPAAILAGALIGIPVLFYLQYWVQASLIKAVLVDSEGGKTPVNEAFEGSRTFILPLFILGLLSGFITFGGFVLFIIPGVILTIWFSLASYVMVKEGKKGFAALVTSREYIRGFGGTVFIYMLIFGIITYAVSLIPTMFLDNTDYQFLSSLYSMLISFIIGPLGMLYSVGIYNELRRIKGDMTVTVTTMDKAKYLAVGVAGTALFLFVFASIASMLMGLFRDGFSPADFENYEQLEQQIESPSDQMEFVPETV